MGGARGLGIAMLVLAVAIATPTFSVAQDPAVPAEQPPAPTPPPLQAEPPAEPAGKDPAKKPEGDADKGQDQGQPAQVQQAQAAPAPAPGGNKAKIAASASVSVGDNFFSPANVTVAVGDTVSWRNNGQAQHSATADNGSFDTGVFGPGQSRAHTFNSAGSFSYFCTVHGQSQSGTVRVLAASGGGGGGNGGGGSNQSEAAAVASPDAAGTSTTLPATGFAALGMALIGFVLLASGHVVKRLERDDEERRRLFSIY